MTKGDRLNQIAITRGLIDNNIAYVMLDVLNDKIPEAVKDAQALVRQARALEYQVECMGEEK